MTHSERPAPFFGIPSASGLLAALGLLLALAALLPGWLLGADVLLRGPGRGPADGAMVPSTALCLALLNGSLLMQFGHHPIAARWMARIALLIAGIGTLTLMLTHVGADYLAGLTSSPSDRMAPATAIGILLAVICARAGQAATRTSSLALRDLRLFLSIFGLSSALTLLIGQVVARYLFTDVPALAGLSLPTTLAFGLFFGAVVCTAGPAAPAGGGTQAPRQGA